LFSSSDELAVLWNPKNDHQLYGTWCINLWLQDLAIFCGSTASHFLISHVQYNRPAHHSSSFLFSAESTRKWQSIVKEKGFQTNTCTSSSILKIGHWISSISRFGHFISHNFEDIVVQVTALTCQAALSQCRKEASHMTTGPLPVPPYKEYRTVKHKKKKKERKSNM
jgi:hypothetical protein